LQIDLHLAPAIGRLTVLFCNRAGPGVNVNFLSVQYLQHFLRIFNLFARTPTEGQITAIDTGLSSVAIYPEQYCEPTLSVTFLLLEQDTDTFARVDSQHSQLSANRSTGRSHKYGNRRVIDVLPCGYARPEL
jgi:hypothetical protein